MFVRLWAVDTLCGVVSVAMELVNVGVRVVAGTAREITYLDVSGMPVTVGIVRFVRLPNSVPRVWGVRRMLAVAETASPRAIENARQRDDVDLVIQAPHLVVLSGVTYVGEVADSEGVRGQDYTRGAIERVLVLARGAMTQAELGSVVGVSQQGVSHLVRRHCLPAAPLTTGQRRELLDVVCRRPEPPVEETYWYGLAAVREQARAVIGYAGELEVPALVGGEVAADRMRPWRVPTSVVIYTDELLDLTDADLVRGSSTDDATLTLRVSDDPTVVATGRWWNSINGATGLGTVDPVMVLRVLRSRHADDGAVEELSEWICRGAHSVDVAGR